MMTLHCEKNENKQKEAWFGTFLKNYLLNALSNDKQKYN